MVTGCLALFSCSCRNSGNGKNVYGNDPAIETNKPVSKKVKVNLKAEDKVFYCGDEVTVSITLNEDSLAIDSLAASVGGSEVGYSIDGQYLTVDTRQIYPGKKRISMKFFLSDSSQETHSVPVVFYSDVVPDNYGYRVIRTYPHDITAYTQGLEYYEGALIEGTGNYGESSLRKVDIETGEILKFRNLSGDIFGEGITLLNDKIYQISYREQVGFVYHSRNFDLIRKIYYQNKEGWGLCNNGSEILMSDGTNVISYMDTTYFSVIRKIYVYDNQGPVTQLNELELINGKLYANRYTTNEIVIIDPVSGKLEGRIDMSGLLKEEDKHRRIDYFNGIAYDKENQRIFVTGKYWPKLYEVKFIKKP